MALVTVFSFSHVQYFTPCTTDYYYACGSLLLSSVVLSEEGGLAARNMLTSFRMNGSSTVFGVTVFLSFIRLPILISLYI